jgi:hypothetical protein
VCELKLENVEIASHIIQEEHAMATVTLNYNNDRELFAFKFVFRTTGRHWVFRYVDSTQKLESMKGGGYLDVCIHEKKKMVDFFLKATSPSEIRFIGALLNADIDSLCKGMVPSEKFEVLAFVSEIGKAVGKGMSDLTGIKIVKYIGDSGKTNGLCNGMLYPVVCEMGDSCLVLCKGNSVVLVSNNNLQFTF